MEPQAPQHPLPPRQHDGWTVTHDHGTGISTWTSPAGSVYERLSPWTAPTPVPPDLQLPPPQHPSTPDVPPGYDDHTPLWQHPEPPREPPHPTGPSPRWDDGPPLF